MYEIAGIEMSIISSGYNCLHLQEYNTQNLTRRVVVIMASDCEGRTQQQIGQKIEEWRKKVGLSQLDLAMVLGLKSDRHYRRICIECTYEFSQSQIGRLAKLMQVSTEELIPDEEFEEDSDYIDNIIKKGSEYKQEQIKNAIVESSKPRFSEAERRIVSYATEIINMEDEELKENYANQMESALKMISIMKQKIT